MPHTPLFTSSSLQATLLFFFPNVYFTAVGSLDGPQLVRAGTEERLSGLYVEIALVRESRKREGETMNNFHFFLPFLFLIRAFYFSSVGRADEMGYM